MLSALSNFHWLRPEWFFALLPLALLLIAAIYQQRRSSQWDQLIPSELLAPLLVGGQRHNNGKWFTLLGLLWLTTTVALAGPSWQKLPQPVSKSQQAIVVLLDLSPSMLAQDLKPSRLIRSRYKLIDLLKAREDGLTGLIAYAGDAHVVTPLTDDTETIISLLPALDPSTMPIPGSQVEQALNLGLQLMRDSGIQKGQFLLITDGVAEEATDKVEDILSGTPFTLSVLAIGTEEGAPIPLPNGFAKDNSGNIVISKLDIAALQDIAQQNGGRFSSLATDNQDINFLLGMPSADLSELSQKTDRLFDTWQDNGAYLCLLLLPFAAFAFRRGFILAVLLAIFSGSQPETAFAQNDVNGSTQEATMQDNAKSFSAWEKLWTTPDQRGQKLLTDGMPEEAAKQFETPEWKASALYSAGKFDAAAEVFAGETATDYYNRGNALAQAGQLEQALETYDKALDLQPEMEDAQYNKKIVEELLKKQQEQEQNGQQQNNQQQPNNSQEGEQQSDKQQNQQGGDENNAAEQESNSESDTNDQAEGDKGEQQANQDGNSADDQASLPDQTDAEKSAEEQRNPYAEQEEQEKEQKDQEEQASTQNAEQQNENDSEQLSGQIQGEPSAEDSEQAQALEQWLRQVPDDPSGLLRQKFNYEHRLRQRQQQWQQAPPDETRW